VSRSFYVVGEITSQIALPFFRDAKRMTDVVISSPGGDFGLTLGMFDVAHSRKMNTHVVGFAQSAAAVLLWQMAHHDEQQPPHVLRLGISLVLPLVEPWRRMQSSRSIAFTPDLGSISAIPASNPAVSHWHFPSLQIIAEIFGVAVLAGIAARFVILALGLLKLRQFRRASSPISLSAESAAALEEMCAQLPSRDCLSRVAPCPSPRYGRITWPKKPSVPPSGFIPQLLGSSRVSASRASKSLIWTLCDSLTRASPISKPCLNLRMPAHPSQPFLRRLFSPSVSSSSASL
jgi:hypothetical protein